MIFWNCIRNLVTSLKFPEAPSVATRLCLVSSLDLGLPAALSVRPGPFLREIDVPWFWLVRGALISFLPFHGRLAGGLTLPVPDWLMTKSTK